MVLNRDSNLELLRILAMLGIVASHYIGYIRTELEVTYSPLYDFLLIQANWGKIGINCFMLISGYFMCEKSTSLKKFIKLLAWIYFYILVFRIPLVLSGLEPNNFSSWSEILFPWRRIDFDNFITCFLVFYCFTPFIQKLIHALPKNDLGHLILLLAIVYIGYNNIPGFYAGYDQIVWFTFLYLVAGYIRMYGCPVKNNSIAFWGCNLLLGIAFVISSSIIIHHLGHTGSMYKFSGYTNSIFAFYTALSSFMFFKNIKIPYSKIINLLGGVTFGVLLIHTNGSFIRRFIFVDILNSPSILNMSFGDGIAFFSLSIIVLFIVCAFIDILRKEFVEPCLLRGLYKLFKLA